MTDLATGSSFSTGARRSAAANPRGLCGVRRFLLPTQPLTQFANTSPLPHLSATYQNTIPKCIPNGEYLLRIQSLAIHNPGSTPQFYISCAQVNVTGGGSATPGPTVKIPGAFKATDPGYTANVSYCAF